MIETEKLFHAMAFSSPENYFSYDGSLLKKLKIFHTASLSKDVSESITSLGGRVVESTHLKKSSLPDWMAGHYSKWIPKGQLIKLQEMLAGEISFYEQITGKTGVPV